MMKRVVVFIFSIVLLASAIAAPVQAKQIVVEENSESTIMLDVARRYYTVSEIKKYIDALAVNGRSSIQMHFTDDENVGIESKYLDQTAERAVVNDGIYTNPDTGRSFLTFAQVRELMNYAKTKNVEFIPEIDMPAHMTGFFDLAKIKFGERYVRDRDTGIAWGAGDEAGNLDIVRPAAKEFLYNIYDEYTDFFKDCKYFHMGFDEYPFRIDEKIDFGNEMYEYLATKGFTVRMWSDAVTKANISRLNNNIEIVYWGWWDDVERYGYATVPDFQEAGFKLILTNRFYLFFVPYLPYMTEENNAHTIRDIEENWELERWNYNFDSTLESHDGIMGGMVCIWGENSAGVSDVAIREQGVKMYNAMFPKLDVFRRIVEVDDEVVPSSDTKEDSVDNPATFDEGIATELIAVLVLLFGLVYACRYFKSIKVLQKK
jgi:hexosaminidase